MNYIIGPRGSGRSSYILKQRERTGGRIYTATKLEVRALKEKARMLGYSPDNIEEIMFGKNGWLGTSFVPGEFVYFDGFEIIFKNMFGNLTDYPKNWELIKPVAAITTDKNSMNLNPIGPSVPFILHR